MVSPLLRMARAGESAPHPTLPTTELHVVAVTRPQRASQFEKIDSDISHLNDVDDDATAKSLGGALCFVF